MGNSLVFGPDNVSKLYGNILFISKFGFENIYFLPRLYELWNEKDLKLLKFNFEKIEKYYVSLFKEGDPKKIFTIPYLRKYIDNNNIKTFHCDKLNMDWRGDLLIEFADKPYSFGRMQRNDKTGFKVVTLQDLAKQDGNPRQ